MGTILDKIIAKKKLEVKDNKDRNPVKTLEESEHFERTCLSMKEYIQRPDLSGIIAEIKRKSPSKGIINHHVSVEQISSGYVEAGASGLSILTDNEFFDGSNDDLILARNINSCPILRKDFTVDEYQIIEAKSIGADIILLIAACLSSQEIVSLASFAKSIGLEVLMEVYRMEELSENLNEHLDIIGVNNRDLKTFETSVNTSYELADLIPNDFVRISESGLNEPQTLVDLKKVGFGGFLIGENFMKHDQPEIVCRDFIIELKDLERTANNQKSTTIS